MAITRATMNSQSMALTSLHYANRVADRSGHSLMEVRAKLQGKPKKGVSLVLAVSLTSSVNSSTLCH